MTDKTINKSSTEIKQPVVKSIKDKIEKTVPTETSFIIGSINFTENEILFVKNILGTRNLNTKISIYLPTFSIQHGLEGKTIIKKLVTAGIGSYDQNKIVFEKDILTNIINLLP